MTTEERDPIEEGMQRLDFLRVLDLALASNGIVDVDSRAVLHDIEECGYTYRLTTPEERRRRREAP